MFKDATTKRCSRCGTAKPLDAFHRDASRPDGVYSACRACVNAAWRARSRAKRDGTFIARRVHGPIEPLPETKACSKCGIEKPIDAYGKQKGGRHGRHPTCKECRTAAERARYVEKRDQILVQQRSSPVRQEWRRRTERLRRYGVTYERFEAAVAAQEGRCAACGDEAPLVLDHDHETGEVRGLLCSPCNIALGHLRDDPVRLRGALAYLENPPGLPS